MANNRITNVLSKQVLEGISSSIASRPALGAAAAKFVAKGMDEQLRRKRIVLLNLHRSRESTFWQILQNTPERFQIISEKESHQRGEYVVRVIFYEVGENLPVYKSQAALIEEYTGMPEETELGDV